jgi:hypothetical protein
MHVTETFHSPFFTRNIQRPRRPRHSIVQVLLNLIVSGTNTFFFGNFKKYPEPSPKRSASPFRPWCRRWAGVWVSVSTKTVELKTDVGKLSPRQLESCRRGSCRLRETGCVTRDADAERSRGPMLWSPFSAIFGSNFRLQFPAKILATF